MAIRHILTLGYGFASGTAFIPTLGFTPSTAPTTPFRFVSKQCAAPGFKSAQTAQPGFVDAQASVPGFKSTQVRV